MTKTTNPTTHRLTILLLLVAGLALLTLTIGTSSAETITVDDDGTEDYEKIQYAIDNATEGDTIFVKEGTYYENVIVNKTVNLVGESNETTIIDGMQVNDTVYVTADWVNISGFRVTNSSVLKMGYLYAGGIYITANHTHVTNCNVSENGKRGIYLENAYNNLICNNSIISNSLYGITSTYSGNNVYRSNFVYNHSFLYSMGIFIAHSNNETVIDSYIEKAHYRGISLSHDSHNFTIINNTVTNANAGIVFSESNNGIVKNNSLKNQYAGISISKSSKNQVENNICFNHGSYGIKISLSNTSQIRNNLLHDNPEGIYISNSEDLIITNNIVFSNDIGIYLRFESQNNTITNNNIYNNTDCAINATDNNGYPVNARNNWFGHPSGPYHLVNNTDGKGDNITDYVLFDPWLGKPDGYETITPVISITSNLVLVGDEVTFTGSVDEGKTIKKYLWMDGETELYNGTENTFTSDTLTTGTHTITLKVLDSFDIWSEEVTEELIVHEKPTAEIVSILPESPVEGEELKFTGLGIDDGAVERYLWMSGNEELYNGSKTTFYLSDLSNGTHNITLKVMDNYGVWSEEVSTEVFVNAQENKIPNITITKPKEGNTIKGVVTFNGMVSDEHGNVTRILVTILGKEAIHDSINISKNGPWSYIWDTASVEDGNYWIIVQCFDGTDYSAKVHVNVTVENKDDLDNESNSDDGLIPGFGMLITIIAVFFPLLWKRNH